MYNLIRGAVLMQLAEHFELPQDIVEHIQQCTRKRANEKISEFIESRRRASLKDVVLAEKFKNYTNAMRDLVRDQQSPEDFACLIHNYERITKRTFEKPAWLTTEMKKIEAGGSQRGQ